ncbi:MAG: alanine racemase [Hyphomonadaceae bacterium]|nr:alanine racemase [Clostridia bacterium]
MSSYLRRVWAEVNLDNIAHNVKEIRRIVTPRVKIMAVTKADAYGHGYLEVAKTLVESGADYFGVAFLDEAKQLRRNGFELPILILGYTPLEWVHELVAFNIIQTVYNFEAAQAISQAAYRVGKQAKIHVKIDTGMNRLGFLCNEQSIQTILDIAKLPNLEIEGIFTHFASADETDRSFTVFQYEKFMEICKALHDNGLSIPVKHACNSAATIGFPEMHLDMVRPGLILYGLYPSEEVDHSLIQLKPAMELKAMVTYIKQVPSEMPVSYGRTYTTKADTKIATVPIGYADGYSRLLAHKAKILINGQFAPVIGRICMDQCMIDVSSVNNIAIGDEVVIFGEQGGQSIFIEEIAATMGTINYELLCVIGKRVPRVYIFGGHVVEVLNYLA